MEGFFRWCELNLEEIDPKIIVRAKAEWKTLQKDLYDFDHPRRQRKAMKMLRELADDFQEAANRTRRH